MTIIQNFVLHSERVQKMARTIGVDLSQAVMAGRLRNFPFSDIVFRCSKCPEHRACAIWLDAHETGATDPPAYCRNKVVLKSLQG
jgi:Family of unknown function (DUF6455)